jgi:hypothetical protein
MRLPRLFVGANHYPFFLLLLLFLASLHLTRVLISNADLGNPEVLSYITSSRRFITVFCVFTVTFIFVSTFFLTFTSVASLIWTYFERILNPHLFRFINVSREYIFFQKSGEDGDFVNCEELTLYNYLLKKCYVGCSSMPINDAPGTILARLEGLENKVSVACVVPGLGQVFTSKHASKDGLISFVDEEQEKFVEQGLFLTLPNADVIHFGQKEYPSIRRAPRIGEALYLQTLFGSVKGVVVSVLPTQALVTFPRLPGSSGSPAFTSTGKFVGIYSRGYSVLPVSVCTYSILFRGMRTKVVGIKYEAIINFTVNPTNLDVIPRILIGGVISGADLPTEQYSPVISIAETTQHQNMPNSDCAEVPPNLEFQSCSSTGSPTATSSLISSDRDLLYSKLSYGKEFYHWGDVGENFGVTMSIGVSETTVCDIISQDGWLSTLHSTKNLYRNNMDESCYNETALKCTTHVLENYFSEHRVYMSARVKSLWPSNSQAGDDGVHSVHCFGGAYSSDSDDHFKTYQLMLESVVSDESAIIYIVQPHETDPVIIQDAVMKFHDVTCFKPESRLLYPGSFFLIMNRRRDMDNTFSHEYLIHKKLSETHRGMLAFYEAMKKLPLEDAVPLVRIQKSAVEQEYLSMPLLTLGQNIGGIYKGMLESCNIFHQPISENLGTLRGRNTNRWSIFLQYIISKFFELRRQLLGIRIASRVTFFGRIVGPEVHSPTYNICVIDGAFEDVASLREYFGSALKGDDPEDTLRLQPLDVH